MKLLDYLQEKKTYIIAEMSGNHGGDLEQALSIVRAAANAGADCLKIQTYTADTITINCKTEPFLVQTGLWKDSYLYDLYSKAYTPWEWHRPIKEEAERLGMDFLSTPFDLSAVDFLEELGVELYKIASFEIVDIPLIRKAAQTGKPVIISCGMANQEEIHEAVDTVHATGNPNVILLKCCSAYPAKAEDMHLFTIKDMQKEYQVPIGLSDHSKGSFASVLAVAMDAVVVEKHLCLAGVGKTVDSDFSLNEKEFADLVLDIRKAERAIGPAAVYGPAESEKQSYAHRRSLFAVKDIAVGEKITADNVRSIRPACGLHTRYYDEIIQDYRAVKHIPFGTPLSWNDIEK